jgi:hypothetical protein
MLLAAAFLATAAGASTVDTRLLVLQRADVPATLGLDRHASRYWSNAALARSAPEVRKLLASSGRISGYTATYEDGAPAIVSVAHLFRKGAGAHASMPGRTPGSARSMRSASSVAATPTGTSCSSSATKRRCIARRGRQRSCSSCGAPVGSSALARVQQRRVEKTLG